MKTLILDIETSPNIAYIWKMWRETVGLNQMLDFTKVICVSAKWEGDKSTYFYVSEEFEGLGVGSGGMLLYIWEMLDEADAVVTYNGKSFDIPHLNREFLLAGMEPPSPFKHIDIIDTVKKQFRFTSNKLQHLLEQLGFKGKVKVDFDLWAGCMAHDHKSWKTMEKYNRRDVTELEELYHRLLPWIVGHPNVSIDTVGRACPTCGSRNVEKRGFARTNVSVFQQWHCKDCGRYSRSRNNVGQAELQVVAA